MSFIPTRKIKTGVEKGKLFVDFLTTTSSNDVNELLKSLEEASRELLKWFDNNLMQTNPDKFNLLFSSDDNIPTRIENFQIEITKRKKIDNQLYFDYHLSEICKKSSRKLYPLVE